MCARKKEDRAVREALDMFNHVSIMLQYRLLKAVN